MWTQLGLNVETAVLLGGLAHFGILAAGLVMTRTLQWDTELKKLAPLSEHIIWAHGAYIWFTILAFALVSVIWPHALIYSRPLGPAITVFISLFWGVRLVIQFFYFDASPYLNNVVLRCGYHGLTLCFGYLACAYAYACYIGLN